MKDRVLEWGRGREEGEGGEERKERGGERDGRGGEEGGEAKRGDEVCLTQPQRIIS